MLFFIIILAIVQGLTEFLPVSSSGHLVLLNKFFGISNDFLLLSVILHVATLLSVVWVLRKQVWQIIRHPFSKQTKLLVVATIPTVVIVVLFKGFFDSAFDGRFLPICFMLTAMLILVSEYLSKKQKNKQIDLNYK
ncbi:MAG: undecaprenyl-diphosphate phosphatase, partial [Clostridiales bacterium]|nr:undecaprenyl-diphosphate phosphatase [Clostridiales bacterium]